MRRVIYSLKLELDAVPGPEGKMLFVQLDQEGNTEKSYVLGKPRMIDVRVGDMIHHPTDSGRCSA